MSSNPERVIGAGALIRVAVPQAPHGLPSGRKGSLAVEGVSPRVDTDWVKSHLSGPGLLQEQLFQFKSCGTWLRIFNNWGASMA